MYDVAVIGKGLVGSAAARYLSAAGVQTLLIGPDEPASFKDHNGVFASHYDEGRLAYHSKRHPIWARLAARSIRLFPELQARSGVEFYTPSGYLGLVRKGESLSEYLQVCARLEAEFGFKFQRFDQAVELAEVYPDVALPEGFAAFLDPAPSGHINPRKLIAAQLAIAQQQGLSMLRETVAEIQDQSSGLKLRTFEGRTLEARAVLIATGSFANCFNLLPKRPALWVKNEFVTLAQVSSDQAQRLRGLPVIGYDVDSQQIQDVYLVPPVRYPDGHFYFKLGSNTVLDRELPDLIAIQSWMRSQGSIEIKGQQQVLHELFPKVDFGPFSTHHCLISRTPNRLPFIDQVFDKAFVALGCNGTSAMSSDALGDLASRLILGQPWWEGLNPADLKMLEA